MRSTKNFVYLPIRLSVLGAASISVFLLWGERAPGGHLVRKYMLQLERSVGMI
jgi:hypothetical protein